MVKNADKDNVKDCMEKFVNIDGKEYKFNIPVYGIELDDLSTDNKKLQQIFSAFDDGNKRLSTFELKNIFATFQNMDVTGKNQKADNILSDDEIQQAISNNEKLKDFSVKDIKLFIKTLVQANNKKINEHKKYAKYVAEGIYEQISGPSLNKNTIKKLKNIDSSNAYYVLTEYEKMAKEPLVQALGEEWNFSVTNIKHYVLKPLVNQASWLGIEVSEDYYQNENNVKKLNTLAKTLCSAIKKELDNPKFNRNGKSATKLSNPDNKKTEQKTEKKDPPLCKEKPKDIAKQLFDQISGASLNKNTIALLKKIGKNNAAQVIDEYKKIAGQSLADAIDEEWGLDIKTVKEYLCKPLLEQAKSLDIYWANTAEQEYKNITSMESINHFIDIWSKEIVVTAENKANVPQKINVNDFTLENLKKKYPDKECRQMGKIILIKNQNGSNFMEIDLEDDGKIRIYDMYNNNNEYTRTRCYNPDGTLDYFSVNDMWRGVAGYVGKDREKSQLKNQVNEIFEDIYRKIFGIIPSQRKSLSENIKQIKPENILEILALYQNKTGESLFNAIQEEVNLGDTRKVLLEHLNTTLDKAFTSLSEGDIFEKLNQFKNKTDLNLIDSIAKNSGMSKDKKQAFLDKINLKIQGEIKKINANNIEETLKKYQEKNISITELISTDNGLADSVKKAYLKHINQAMSKYIDEMGIWSYMSDRVRSDYDDIEKPTLIQTIVKEKGLNGEEKVKLIRQLKNRITNEYLSSETKKDDIEKLMEAELNKIATDPDFTDVEFLDRLFCKLYSRDLHTLDDEKKLKAPNGKIDDASYQGGTGDCWLLAAINAIARSKKGLEILNNSLKVNSDGSVTVHLKGVNKSYTISKDDLYAAKELSSGDMDVRAIEIAFERYMLEYKRDDLNGNNASFAFDVLLGGKKTAWKWIGTKLDDSYKEKINNPNILVVASIGDTKKDAQVKSSDGEEIYAHHAYTVVRADDKFVYLINPYNSSRLLKLSYKEFKSIFDNFTDMEI